MIAEGSIDGSTLVRTVGLLVGRSDVITLVGLNKGMVVVEVVVSVSWKL